MKKILSYILTVAVAVGCMRMSCLEPNTAKAASAAESNTNEAYALLYENVQKTNFDTIEMGEETGKSLITRVSETVWCMDKDKENASYKICFDLAPEFAENISDGSSFDIEVEYYSQDDGYFQIIYDSLTKEDRRGEIIYTGSTNNWEKAVFNLEDAYFGNRLDGKYDFELTIKATRSTNSSTSACSVPVKSVRVVRHTAENPVMHYGYTNESGNVFEYYREDKPLYNKFTNTTDKTINADVTYRAVTQEGAVKWTGSEKVTLAPKEVKETSINVDTDYCDLYTLYVDIKDEENGIDESFERYDFAVVKTDPDGIKNENHYFAAHFARYFDTADEGVEVMAKTNTNGIRTEFGWPDVETSATLGTFSYPAEHQRLHNLLKENNLNLMAIFAYSLSAYTGGYMWLPETDDQIKRWSEAMEYIVTQIGDWCDKIEIWNEPNIAMFNGGTGGTSIDVRTPPEGYAKAAIAACEAAHRVNPDIEVGVMSLCGLTQENSFDFFRRAMSTELYNYCDAITMHPYGSIPSEQENFADVLNEYKRILKDEFGVEKDIPIWNTEVGFSESDEMSNSPQKQANHNIRSFLYLHGENVAQAHVEYNFERKGVIAYDREDNFGIVSPGWADAADEFDKNYVPVKAYIGVTGMNYLMAQTTPDMHGNYGEKGSTYIYKYKSDKFNKDIMALWALNDTNMTFDFGVKSLTYSDEAGNMTTIESEDGKYSFHLSEKPFYILGNIKKVEICDEQLITFPTEDVSAVGGDIGIVNIEKSTELGDSVTIRADLPESVKLTEEPTFNGDNAEIRLAFDESISEDSYGRFYIEKDGKILSVADIDFAIAPVSASAYLNVGLRDGRDMNKWDGTIRITNHSNTNVAMGTVEFLYPEEFAKAGKQDIGRIPRGKTSDIKFSFPDITKKGIYNVRYRITLDSGEYYDFSERVDFTVASYRKGDVKIDGYINDDEWETKTWMYADSADDVGIMIAGSVWGGPDDLSAKATVMWDEDNFYMAAIVTDNVQYSEYEPSMSYQGDDIQFAIYHDINSYLAAGQAGVDFNEFGISLSTRGPAMYKWKCQTDDTKIGDITDPGCECMVRREGNQTYYELKMPWKVMFGYDYAAKAGDYLGFSYAVNENDGAGRVLYIEYAGGIVGGKNANLFSKLQLVKP